MITQILWCNEFGPIANGPDGRHAPKEYANKTVI